MYWKLCLAMCLLVIGCAREVNPGLHPEVKKAIARVDSDDPAEIRQALKELSSLDKKGLLIGQDRKSVFQALERLMRREDVELSEAMSFLAKATPSIALDCKLLVWPQFHRILIESKYETDRVAALTAIESIGLGNDDIEVLSLATQKDSSSEVRRRAVVMLGKLKREERAEAALRTALHDDDPAVREAAAKVLDES